MSIIHDALNKAGNSKKEPGNSQQAKTANDIELANTIIQPSQIKPQLSAPQVKPVLKTGLLKSDQANQAKTRKLFMFFAVLAVFALFAASRFYLSNIYAPLKITLPKFQKTPKAQPSENAVPIQPKQVKQLGIIKTQLVLSGIAHSDGRSVAVINDAIYSVGESVDGANIVKISADEVYLEKDGEEIVLKVK